MPPAVSFSNERTSWRWSPQPSRARPQPQSRRDERRAVAHADVDEQQGGGVEQRRDEHRVVAGRRAARARGPGWIERVTVVEEVHVVGRLRVRARERQDVGLGRTHARQRDRAGRLDAARRAAVVGSPPIVKRAPRRSTPASIAAWQISTAVLA